MENEMKLREQLSQLKIGDSVFWNNEKEPLTVKARDKRYIIVSKPIPDNFEYSIIDTKEMICGCDDRVFGIFDYLDSKDCLKAIDRLNNEDDDFEISYRNRAKCINVLHV